MPRLFLIVFISLLTSCSHMNRGLVDGYKKFEVKQVGEYTCWAAVQQGILSYSGSETTQYEVVRKFAKSMYYFDLSVETFELYKDTSKIGLPDYHIRDALSVDKKIAKKSVEKLIDSDEPIVVLANNHVSVIVGYSKINYYVADPWFGKIIVRKKSDYKMLSRDKRIKERAKFFTINSMSKDKKKELKVLANI